tara:strand:- start:317 stop:808 length:492 start_codon:yes stop_codon:yes gene_type:complete
MTTRNESRSTNQRETEVREEEWTFEEPNALEIPKPVQARFDAEDMALRWIRVSLQGKDDYINVGKKQQEGWVFVSPDEVPEMALTSFVREDGRYEGTVSRGDLALAKMPAGKVRARQKFYEQKSNDMMDAVNAQLMKNSDSRMPITNSSRSVTTRGRRPNFQG